MGNAKIGFGFSDDSNYAQSIPKASDQRDRFPLEVGTRKAPLPDSHQLGACQRRVASL